MFYNTVTLQTIALIVLHSTQLGCIHISGSPTYNNSHHKLHNNPTNSQMRSLKTEYEPNKYSNTDILNPGDISMNESGDQIKDRSNKDPGYSSKRNNVANNNFESSTENLNGPFSEIVESHVVKDDPNELVDKKFPESAYDSSGNFIEKINNIRNSVDSIEKRTMGSMVVSRKERDIKTEIRKRGLKHGMQTSTETEHIIRSKRKVFKRHKNHSLSLNNATSPEASSKRKRPGFNKIHKTHKRLAERKPGSTLTPDEDLKRMQISSKEPLTTKTSDLFAEEFLVTTEIFLEESITINHEKIKKEQTDGSNDLDQSGITRHNPFTYKPEKHSLSNITRKRHKHKPESRHLTKNISNERGIRSKHKHHSGISNVRDKSIAQRNNPTSSRTALEKRQKEPETTTPLTTTTHHAADTSSSSTLLSPTLKTTSSLTTTINRNLTSDDKQKITKFSADLKQVVWNYIDAQKDLDETRKNDVFAKVLQKIPDLVMRHINEVLSR